MQFAQQIYIYVLNKKKAFVLFCTHIKFIAHVGYMYAPCYNIVLNAKFLFLTSTSLLIGTHYYTQGIYSGEMFCMKNK